MADTWVHTDNIAGYVEASSYETYCFAAPWVADQSFTCDRVGFYVFADSVNDPTFKLCVYDASYNVLATATSEGTADAVGWQDFDLDGDVTITDTNTYYVGHETSGAATTQWRYRNATPPDGGSPYENNITYPTFPDPLTVGGTSSSRYGAMRMGYGDVTTYKLEGVTKNKNGAVLGTCDCFLFKMNAGEDDADFVDYDQSDISGNYSFTGILDNDAKYFVVAWKDNTPTVFDCTDHVLVPVEE